MIFASLAEVKSLTHKQEKDVVVLTFVFEENRKPDIKPIEFTGETWWSVL